ncbi:retrotransposon protein, putative, ty1-copia subclass [Tanacetum coccineum]
MGYAPVQAPPFAPKPKNPATPKKGNPAKDAICHQCGEVGHWRRNCPIYLAELMKKKKLSQGASTSGIFTIELYYFPSTSWVYDTGCGTHICIITQGLRGSRKLNPRALSLYVGDGHRAIVEAIGEFHLCLPSRLVLILHNCQYAPSITRGIISVSHLYKDDDIYEIVLSSSNTNDSSMYVVSNKRANLNLVSALLWHCCLGYINKKCIEKLQHDGHLNSTDIKSFEKCVSCMSGKMARKPYSHQVERAKDLLGLIHTDVCGPFMIMPRQGASYFITFTDDFIRYGYVYLLKHKHEVFETFKVFQKKVENQLGKTIKSLRSDRGGEYISQEFLDHLKECGIIAHRTPPYMPQHNGVSERRNKTLLDMVRSMMSQTTLPKSFWDYALEFRSVQASHHGSIKGRLIRHHTKYDMGKTIRYLKEMMGYSFYYPPENKVFVSRNAEFLESSLISQEASGSLKDLEIIQKEDMHPSIDTSLYHEENDQEIDEHQNIRAIRILIAITAFYDNEIWQMDVKTTFLNGYLNEEVYMSNQRVLLIRNFQTEYASLSVPFMDLSKHLAHANIIYALTVGSIMYAVRCTHPDVAFAQNITSRFQQNSGELHWTTVKNILKYLHNTNDMFLVYEGVVDWKSTKQTIFATSSTDAEYINAFDASKESVWIRKFISGLGVVPTIEEPMNMYCDNTRAIAIAKDHGVTKGIEKVDTDDNLADPFTKALAFPKHSELTEKIEMIPANVANYQYICKPATPTPKWELLEYGGRFCKLYVRNT